jgi:hypothetical protein
MGAGEYPACGDESHESFFGESNCLAVSGRDRRSLGSYAAVSAASLERRNEAHKESRDALREAGEPTGGQIRCVEEGRAVKKKAVERGNGLS